MLYKTITLELLADYPILYNRLRLSRTLMAALDRHASELRTTYLKWIALGTDASTARELALEELHDRFAQEAARLEA